MSKRQAPGQTRTCASCHTVRGNVRAGWNVISRGDAVTGATCPQCPEWAEPIRRVVVGDRVRYLAVVSGTPGQDGKRRQLKRRFDVLSDARG